MSKMRMLICKNKHDSLTNKNKVYISYIRIAPSESLGAHLSSSVLVDLFVHSATVVLSMIMKFWSYLLWKSVIVLKTLRNEDIDNIVDADGDKDNLDVQTDSGHMSSYVL